ncbi:MAG: HAMP domain-containing histidine kinase, partial [Oscillospiraceae bacterium]|nr:HAMP domain-containing histidine kinase [Oscillospiraceae bacterium]
YGVFLSFNVAAFLFSVLTLAVLTCICSHLLSLAGEYEKANAEKIRAERFKAELITNVSHDIRTPLTSIISYVDLLKALPVEREDFLDYVNVLDRKSARLKTLINDLMEASKAAAGNVAVDLREVDLSEIAGQIAGEFDDRFAERNLTFVLRQPDAPVSVHADSGHLWRVLENLFGNAAKYALPGTRVFAEISLRGGRAVLSLKNTSENPIDLPADALTEQFIRGDRARRTDGSGLGLYIAKSLTELMDGQFTIRSTGDLFEVETALLIWRG